MEVIFHLQLSSKQGVGDPILKIILQELMLKHQHSHWKAQLGGIQIEWSLFRVLLTGIAVNT